MEPNVKPVILPILTPDIDWEQFYRLTQSVLGRSTTRGLDAAGRSPGDLASFVSCLGEMQTPGCSPTSVLEEPGSLLRHLYFGVLGVCPDDALQFVNLNSGLAAAVVATAERGYSLALITGSLEDWRVATICCCVDRSPQWVRMLFNQVLLHFEQIGLQRVWFGYHKVQLPDSSFRLEHRSP